jgi:hypothetical protein
MAKIERTAIEVKTFSQRSRIVSIGLSVFIVPVLKERGDRDSPLFQSQSSYG